MSETLCAAAPFDHAKADVILRSSDNVHFRIFKLFLALASPFFETLFEIPQPDRANGEQEVKDGLAVIPVAEDSKTLDALLRFCYPCTLTEQPSLEVLQDAMDVLEAAKKYSLDAIEKKARRAISNPKILEAEPLRCFALAHKGELREETLLAAKSSLTQPLIPTWFKEIELVSSTNLLALLTYHKRCGDAVYDLRTNTSWIRDHYASGQACAWLSGRYHFSDYYGNSTYNNCACERSTTSRYVLFGNQVPRWWDNFMEETFTELRDKPCKETLQAAAEKTIQAIKALNCQACSPAITEGMREFLELFVSKIEEAVSKIQLELDF